MLVFSRSFDLGLILAMLLAFCPLFLVGSLGATVSGSRAAESSESCNPNTLLDGKGWTRSLTTCALNMMIAAAALKGGGLVQLPAGRIQVSQPGIIMRSGVALSGAGGGGTTIVCSVGLSAPCVGKMPGAQLSRAKISQLKFLPAGPSDDADTVIDFDNLQSSEISHLYIVGFNRGTWLRLGGRLPRVLDDPTLGGNVIWNAVEDVVVYGCEVCAVLQGDYVSLNGKPGWPQQVLTQNHFDNINMFLVNKKGWDIIKAADTNMFFGGLINLIGDGAIGVVSADDQRFVGQNVYVGNNKFFGTAFSHFSTKNLILFGGDYSTGTEGYGVESDIDASKSLVPVKMPLASSYKFCGNARFASGPGVLLGCLARGQFGEESQIIKLGQAPQVKVSAEMRLIVFDGGGTFVGGYLQLPCDAPDGQELTVSSVDVEIEGMVIGACAPDAVAGSRAGAILKPVSPIRMRYVSDLHTWIYI